MASSDGQAGRGPRSRATRERLMAAAAELIAERGWGGVTTRAVAERAELPHGAVSYHFRGKRELLFEAALHTFRQAFPEEGFAALGSVDALLEMIASEVTTPAAVTSDLSRLMLEAMREADRDAVLRERMAALLDSYRQMMVATVRADQERGAVTGEAPPEALATLIAALTDGLALHVLLEPELDAGAALAALRALLAPPA